MENKLVYPNQFYKIKEGDITVDTTLAAEVVKGKKIAGWTIEDEDLVKNMNLGTLEVLSWLKQLRIWVNTNLK